ncbi:MAG TPA: iron-containing alcohol dehydrogenase [Bacteroidales bacterium]|nr:iron-containing alcohol dehydrogenase [Bacteroidales bacterium]
MENFEIYNPVKAYFGKDVIHKLAGEISARGKKVLLVYGKGSIKSNGIYDAVIQQLGNAGAEVYEYSGIKPNPVIDDVRAAVTLGKQKNVDMVLAVGGGRVIDSAKAICVGIPGDVDPWDFVKGRSKPEKGVPLIAVLTLAATGTEMNRFSVIQDDLTKEKLGFGYPPMYPAVSFLDPSYTLSVSADYTAFGISDLVAHALEAYFGKGDASLSDRFVFSIIKEAMEYGPALMDDLQNYDLRARIMYAATAALNNLTMYGRVSGDWGVHGIGHILSVLYDVPHGASLSITYPAWMRLRREKAGDRIRFLGENLFGTNTIDECILGFEAFFTRIQSPVRISQTSYGNYNKEEIIATMKANKVSGAHHKMEGDDYQRLLDLMW